MNTKSQRFITNATIIVLVFGIYGYFRYTKVAKEKWLSGLDIATFLIEPDDLPSGYSPGVIRNIEPNEYWRFIQAKEQQILASDDNEVGLARIFLFSIDSEKGEMFNLLSLMETPEGMISIDATGVGEMQLAAIDPFGLIVFTRCTAVGYIQVDFDEIKKGYDTDALIAHAKRLDEKLKTIACEQP